MISSTSRVSFLWLHKRASDDSRSSRMVDLKYILRSFIAEKDRSVAQTMTGKLAESAIESAIALIKKIFTVFKQF